jgi:hypothetical protein
MGLSRRQVFALKRDVKTEHVRTRLQNGRELSYIEGSHAIAEANRIFGFDGWDRETVESKCVLTRESRGTFLVAYISKVRITVRAAGITTVREGHGCGEARGGSPGEAHDLALKTSETDATKRALATFGKPFGLSLYLNGKSTREASRNEPAAEPVPPPSANVEQTRPQAGVNGQAIDKSALKFGAARRNRDKAHLKFVAAQPCLLCQREPSDPHHLRFAQPRALGMKVSDEFTVPLCREHHRQLHHSGNENAWWHDMGIEPLEIAKTLWQTTHEKQI